MNSPFAILNAVVGPALAPRRHAADAITALARRKRWPYNTLVSSSLQTSKRSRLFAVSP